MSAATGRAETARLDPVLITRAISWLRKRLRMAFALRAPPPASPELARRSPKHLLVGEQRLGLGCPRRRPNAVSFDSESIDQCS